MITIQKQYQYYSPSGIRWTNWFTYKKFTSRSEAISELLKLKKIKVLGKLKNNYKLM